MTKQITKKRKKIKEKSKEFYKDNKDYFKEWYKKKGGKEYCSKYMKEYYKKNKLDLTLVQKKYKLKKNGYNGTMKNYVRNNLIKFIKNDIKNILTLESDKFYFSKLLPEKKIIVFERDLDTFNKMNKTKPKNVSLFLGDISGFKEIDMKIDFIYLDFCGNWTTEKETIFDLKEHIKNTKLFAVTFCLRDNSGVEKLGDYQFDLLNKLNNLTDVNWNVLYGESYKDSVPMITLLLENKQ